MIVSENLVGLVKNRLELEQKFGLLFEGQEPIEDDWEIIPVKHCYAKSKQIYKRHTLLCRKKEAKKNEEYSQVKSLLA